MPSNQFVTTRNTQDWIYAVLKSVTPFQTEIITISTANITTQKISIEALPFLHHGILVRKAAPFGLFYIFLRVKIGS